MGFIQYVLCVVFLFCVTHTSCNLNEFILKLPMEFGNVASNAWKEIVKAIKTPIRIRRLKRNRKTKITTTKITTEFDTEVFTESYVYRVTDTYKIKPTIPVLHEPVWRSMLHWRNIQKPNLIQQIKDLTEGYKEVNEIINYEGSYLRIQKVVEEKDNIIYFM